MGERYWLETLGCPKNAVDSDKIAAGLHRAGYERAADVSEADLVVVNTCAFIEAARAESIDSILDLAASRRDGARLVVTGCLAAKSGEELAAALPEIDLVADVGVPVHLRTSERVVAHATDAQRLDLLEHGRPRPETPYAYVKIAEGCDRRCGFCAIPSFRGPQLSRPFRSVLEEVEQLGAMEIVLVAQDLASYGRDNGEPGGIVRLTREVARRTERVRLLYLYPSALSTELIETILSTGVAYFDLSLQHVSARLLRRMRRFGSAERFLERIASIRALQPDAAFRSSFIFGYPGETEEDHDALLRFLEEAQLDWGGFFRFSREDGTYAAGLEDMVDSSLALERLREAQELQEAITARRRRELVGERCTVLVDERGVGRSFREAPEIDGVVHVPESLSPGTLCEVVIDDSTGPDLHAVATRR